MPGTFKLGKGLYAFYLIFSIIAILGASKAAFAQLEPFNLKADTSNVSIIGSADFFDDESGEMTFEEVSDPSFSSNFTPLTQSNSNRGFATEPRWIRFNVVNNSDKPIEYFMIYPDPFLDNMHVYSSVNGDSFDKTYLDLYANSRLREIDYRLFTVSRIAPQGSETIVYIRLHNIASKISFSNFKIYSSGAFDRMRNIENVFMGLFYGGMLFMFVYNIFIFFSVRDTSYLYYVIYIILSILTWASLNGQGQQFLWPANAEEMKTANMLFPTWTYFFAIMFTRSFLQTATRHPIIDKTLLALSSLCIITTVTALSKMMLVSIALNQITGTLSILFIIIGLYVWKKGYKPALYYAFAWFSVTFGAAIFALSYAGVFPINFITSWSGMVGAAIEVMLLSLALGYRIRILRAEKMEAQKLYQETLEKAKEELEVKVIERTSQLNEQKDRAEDATKLKDKFVSLVSHDLRSPLGSMIGLTQILEADGEDSFNEYQKDILKRMTDTTNGLVNMIDQLLNISRLKTGKLKPQNITLDAHSICRLMVANLEHLATSKGISLINDVKKNTMIFADDSLFGEVISNLVSNAIKFCESGDTITLFTPEGRNTTIAVTDTGVGVNVDILPDIFKHEVKTTTKGTSGEKGTGLGLPFCKDIMEAHEGTLSVESSPGKGTTFYAELPVFRPLILLVDDDDNKRLIFKTYLEQVDADVIEAHNGEEAMKVMTDRTPNLIITDLDMPIMDGYGLLNHVRGDSNLENIPVIVITSSSSMESKDKVFQHGANDFIMLPAEPNEFIPRVKRCLL